MQELVKRRQELGIDLVLFLSFHLKLSSVILLIRLLFPFVLSLCQIRSLCRCSHSCQFSYLISICFYLCFCLFTFLLSWKYWQINCKFLQWWAQISIVLVNCWRLVIIWLNRGPNVFLYHCILTIIILLLVYILTIIPIFWLINLHSLVLTRRRTRLYLLTFGLLLALSCILGLSLWL